MVLKQRSTSHSINLVEHTALGAWQRIIQSPNLPFRLGKGLLSQVFFQLMTVNSKSVVDVKIGNSGMVIGYQIDEFTGTWSAEHFVT